eukprot:jgi/Orpsp1_1/1182817/evm.model.c7180000082761.1
MDENKYRKEEEFGISYNEYGKEFLNRSENSFEKQDLLQKSSSKKDDKVEVKRIFSRTSTMNSLPPP